MSEPRKNHLIIDGAQPKEEEHVASYKPISETDQEFRTSKSSLGKSKEKVASDPAEEKLLKKEDEIKIRPMSTEAKYDHRNGDTKIELDAAKKQFSGLTKEELLKYADDPFWVRLRWFMFVLFWTLWLCMLAGAIAIIVQAPKCAAPPPKTWYESGPLADYSSDSVVNYESLKNDLPKLEEAKVKGVFINPCEETYQVLDNKSCVDNFKEFLISTKDISIKFIVDLTANFVPITHEWFVKSENRSDEFDNYFTWNKSAEFEDGTNTPKLPNNWVSLVPGKPAWALSEKRNEYYLRQLGDHADLNFHNQDVVKRFDEVLKIWVDAGVSGVRLRHARQLVVDRSLLADPLNPGSGAAVNEYHFYKHKYSADQPELGDLFAHWAHIVASGGESVFTVHEDGSLRPEWYLYRNSSMLRPPAAAPRALGPRASANLTGFVDDLRNLTDQWTAIQLNVDGPASSTELAKLTMLLPATPVLVSDQIPSGYDNDTHANEKLSHLVSLREEPSIKYGECHLAALSDNNTNPVLAVARWKAGQPGYVAVFNPSGELVRADLSSFPSVPESLTVYHVDRDARVALNYTNNYPVAADDVKVLPGSTVVLSYVPKTKSEK